ncbi:MAG: type II toxin-antitoxin system VapC family toxin [Chloroflexota bacterium]
MTFLAPLPPVVVDASIAVELVLDGTPGIRSAWESWIDQDRLILAPALFWLEVANALLRGQKLPASDVALRLDGLEAAGLETADRGAQGAREAIELAARHGLTVYDAAYLSLAIEVDGELATRDVALARAAMAAGVTVAFG